MRRLHNMKKVFLVAAMTLGLACASSTVSQAQSQSQGGSQKVHSDKSLTGPRTMGFRVGVSAFEASYQHVFRKDQFLQGDFGVDFGYNVNGRPGIRATAIYNFVWARPAWSHRGFWAIYYGPGLSLGYVNDIVSYKIGEEVRYTPKQKGSNGFMLGIAAQVGVEYTLDFPLSIALEMRPVFGMHVNQKVELGDMHFNGKVGFYDNGMLGFVPGIAVRYRF